MAATTTISRVYVPSDICLTATNMIAALRKMPKQKIEEAVDALIDELDVRSGDPDFEPDLEEDSE